jgi:tryptophan 2,3-dioxygenase
MPKPATWNGEPDCGHDVNCAYQTHYCTYIRVPRLLTLQQPTTPDELLLITAHQWYELWFKVLLTDLRALVADDLTTYEPIKLLRRGIELFRLFDSHADLAESVIIRDAGLTHPVRAASVSAVSSQFSDLTAQARHLRRLAHQPEPALADVAQDYAARLKAFRPRYQSFLKATLLPKKSHSPTYAEWLNLSVMLALQEGIKSAWTEAGRQPVAWWKPECINPDETMFIIVHQCFEIWFKVILEHIDRALPLLVNGDVGGAHRLLRRVLAVMKLLVHQIQIPGTMLPLDFLRFRDMRQERDSKTYTTGLSPASGTESYQFREIEIVCGLRDDPVFRKYLAGTDSLPMRPITPRQAERLDQPTLPEAFRRAARQRGLQRYDDLFTPANVPNPNSDLAALGDTLIEFDEFFRFWRLGHVSMVEKMIGAKSGTGFLGPEYLMETAGIRIQEHNRVFAERQIRPRFFEELWAVRSRMKAY